jgi:hypothetical protein
MEGAGSADLGSLVELLLETKEIDRLVERLRQAKDAELEGLSHYTTQPVAKRLARSHPDVVAKVFRALGMRIAEVRSAHRRKAGFMADFERLVAGQGPSGEPSFLERAKSRWSSRGT